MSIKTPIIKDWMVLGGTTGIALSLLAESINAIMDRTGIPCIRYAAMAGDFILGKQKKIPPTKAEYALGWAAHAATGALYAMTLSYVYSKTPPGHGKIKGVIGGFAWWLTTIGMATNLRYGNMERAQPVNFAINLCMTAAIGGLHGAILDRYATKITTQSHPIITDDQSVMEFQQGLQAKSDTYLPRPSPTA